MAEQVTLSISAPQIGSNQRRISRSFQPKTWRALSISKLGAEKSVCSAFYQQCAFGGARADSGRLHLILLKKKRISRSLKVHTGSFTIRSGTLEAYLPSSRMVETLNGIGQCDRVLTSRRIIFPEIEGESARGKYLMVLTDRGRRAEKTLRQIVRNDVLKGAAYEDLGDNIYLVDEPKEGRLQSVSLQVDGTESRVFFVECSSQHENHWGRCTADGFACGILDMDVWQKILECSGANPITVSRSYHMDCEPDWTRGNEPGSFSEEQQVMLEFGLPLNFGQNKDFSMISDDAGPFDSSMVERDYDKELTDLNSSTERMSVSKSSCSEGADVSDDCEPRLQNPDLPPGSLTKAEFDKYWLLHGERLTDMSWRAKYGDYMTEHTMSDVTSCSDEGICQDHCVADEVNGERKIVAKHLQNIEIENSVRETNDGKRRSCEGIDTGVSEENHDEAWSKLWREHAWEVYLRQMNRLLENEVPMNTMSDVQDQHSISLKSGENLDDSKASENDGGEQKEGSDQGSFNKRPLSLSDFGIVADDDNCTIGSRHIKNHKLKKIKKESHNHKRLPLSVSADALEDAPKDARLAKYWAQRYRLFRKFDDGIRLNETAWFSVTPEKIAEHVAARMSPRPLRKSNFVVSAFCGVGGDAVQLGLRSHSVLAIDNDLETIEMAKHNAGVYGVENKIDFVLADMNTFVPRIAPDAVMFSPPWGGPEYKDRAAFDLAEMEIDFVKIFRVWQKITPNIATILPRNTKVDQLCELGRVEVEQNLLNKKIKTITAYYGGLVCK